jgi:hypothetical protein
LIKVAALEKQPTWFPDTFFTYNLAQSEVHAKEIEIDWSKLSTLPKKKLSRACFKLPSAYYLLRKQTKQLS